MSDYEFQYFFLPRLILNNDFVGKLTISNIKEQLSNSNQIYDCSDLGIKNIDNPIPYSLISFHKSIDCPCAKYIAIIKDNNRNTLIFTLEKGDKGFFFCQLKRGFHNNISHINKKISEEEFINIVMQRRNMSLK